jgi:hypothetical protein
MPFFTKLDKFKLQIKAEKGKKKQEGRGLCASAKLDMTAVVEFCDTGWLSSLPLLACLFVYGWSFVLLCVSY